MYFAFLLYMCSAFLIHSSDIEDEQYLSDGEHTDIMSQCLTCSGYVMLEFYI